MLFFHPFTSLSSPFCSFFIPKHISFGVQKAVFWVAKDRLSQPESLPFAGERYIFRKMKLAHTYPSSFFPPLFAGTPALHTHTWKILVRATSAWKFFKFGVKINLRFVNKCKKPTALSICIISWTMSVGLETSNRPFYVFFYVITRKNG